MNQSNQPRKPYGILLPYVLAMVFITGCSDVPKTTIQVSSANIQHATVVGELGASRTRSLQWQTSGVVDAILPIGSVVEQGDQIASLDPSTLDQQMTQAISELEEISTLIEDRDNNHEIYLESANAAVRYFRKKVEAAENTYKNLDQPKLSEEEFEALKKNLSDAETKMNERYVRYKQLREDGEGAKKIQDAYLEWRAAEADHQELRDWMDKYMAAPTDAEVAIARQKLEDARTQLEQAILIRDNIKSGDHTVLFRHNEGYNSYDPYSNYVFYSSDSWNPVHNTLNDQYEAKKLFTDNMYQFAPFGGEIIFTGSNAGETVANGDRSVILVDRETLLVKVNVPEDIINLIQIGDAVSMGYGSAKLPLSGVVKSISPISARTMNSIDLTLEDGNADLNIERSNTFEVIIDIDQKDIIILLGAPVEVEFQLSEPLPVLVVPEQAIQRDGEGEFVMVASLFGDAYKARVTRGEEMNGQVIVYPLNADMLTSEDKIIDPTPIEP